MHGRRGPALLLLALATLPACAGSPSSRRAADGNDYLRWVSFHVSLGSENVLLRWPERKMPLRVHLPPPPDGLFAEPEAIHDSVRDGVLDWRDVAAPGIPRFEFVDAPGKAAIPIFWAEAPDGAWYIAHCAYDVNLRARRFGVSRILVTARWGDGHVADLHDLYITVLHEMGHALGLGGHSPDPGDVMYPSIDAGQEGLSARDRRTLERLYASPIGRRVAGAKRGR